MLKQVFHRFFLPMSLVLGVCFLGMKALRKRLEVGYVQMTRILPTVEVLSSVIFLSQFFGKDLEDLGRKRVLSIHFHNRG